MVKNLFASARDIRDSGLIPGSGGSAGGGHGNPLQYSCLENPTDRGDWHATVRVARVGHSWSNWAHRRSSLESTFLLITHYVLSTIINVILQIETCGLEDKSLAPGSFSGVHGEPGFEARLLTIGPQRLPNSYTFSMFLKIWRSRPRPHNDKLIWVGGRIKIWFSFFCPYLCDPEQIS